MFTMCPEALLCTVCFLLCLLATAFLHTINVFCIYIYIPHLYVNQCPFKYVCNCIYGCDYLHTVDADPAHAAATVNEEDELAMNLPQV